MSLCRRGVVVGIVASMMVAVPALGSAAGASRSTALFGAPKVGTCYDISGKVAAKPSVTSSTRACSKVHTLWIVAVRSIPASVVAGQGSGPPNPATQRTYDKVCVPAIKRSLGSLGAAFARSAYEGFWFFPSAAQQKHGAHWMSCETGVLAGHEKLSPSKAKKPMKVTAGLPDRIRMCGTPRYYVTDCADKHTYRESYSFLVKKRSSSTVAQRQADRTCPKHVHSAAWMYVTVSVGSTKRFYVTCLTQTSA
jgi:hypothetical protein